MVGVQWSLQLKFWLSNVTPERRLLFWEPITMVHNERF